MSKPVAAAAILRLAEERHFDLDADVNTLLRSWHVPWPADSARPVTLRGLLSHNAGINVHGFAGYDRDAAVPTLLEVLDGAPPANNEAVRVTATPGTTTEYSGGGTSIAQQVAVDVSGEPFSAFMQQTLLGPLRMTHSTFEQPLPRTLWPLAADGYYVDGTPVHRGWHVYPMMAAAGLWTTPADLATFVIAIQNALHGRGMPPIDRNVAREMTTKTSQSFALGPEIEPGYFTHNGANEGFQGIFVGLTAAGRGVVVMTNSDDGLALADEVVHSVANAYGWPVLRSQPKTAIPLTAAAIRDVAGKYGSNTGGTNVTLAVTQAPGGHALSLRMSFNGHPAQLHAAQLYAEAPLRFFTLGGASLVFKRTADGRVGSVQIGNTVFERL